MNKLSFIRWKFVIPVGLVITGILVFFIVFFDPLFARVLESVASKANQAKVNVDGLKTKFFKGRLSIERVQVTNREQVMKNVVEAGPMVFEMNLMELFSKRFIIPQATLDGLKFNTDRKTSGKLLIKEKPAKDEKPSAAARLAEKYKDRFKISLEGMKDQAKQKIDFDPKDLSMVKQANALKEKSNTLPEQWKTRVNSLKIEDRLKNVEKQIDEIKKTPTSGDAALTAIPASLQKLKDVRAELDQIKTDVKTTKDSLGSEIKNLKGEVAGLADAKKKDVDDLLSRFNLDFANPKKLAAGIVGPVLLDRVKTGISYLQMARKYMPAKEDEIPEKPRAKGSDIVFPTPAALPRFWLAKAGLSGAYEDVSASGQITDLTSNPARIGKPLLVTIKGNQQQKLFSLNGIVDQVSAEKKAELSLAASQIPLSEVFTSGFLADAVSQGAGALNMTVGLQGENGLNGKIGFSMKGLRVETEKIVSPTDDAYKTKFIMGIARGIEAMPSIDVTGSLTGTLDDPDFNFETNLTSQMTNVVKATVGNMVQEQRAELEAKLQTILTKEQGELNAKVGDMQNKLNEVLGGFDAKIQSKVNEAAGISLSPAGGSGLPKVKIPSFDKLFK